MYSKTFTSHDFIFILSLLWLRWLFFQCIIKTVTNSFVPLGRVEGGQERLRTISQGLLRIKGLEPPSKVTGVGL